MALVNKTPTKTSASATFPEVGAGGKAVRVEAGKGGVRVGVTHCTSKRSASNLKNVYDDRY